MAAPETPAYPTTADAADVSSTNAHSLHKAVQARRSEYIRRHRTRIKIGTWNVAACPGTDKDLARWFVDGEGLDPALGSAKPSNSGVSESEARQDGSAGDEGPIELAGSDRIGLYVLGLQEVHDLSAPGQYMTWIYAADATSTGKWKAALEAALPEGYQLVAAEQLAGMLLLAYAAPEVAPTISNVSSVAVGTGALGYLGNKGAVCTRIVFGEATRLLLVNCHLASGVEDYYLERRVNQVQQIMAQARFEPVTISGASEEEGSRIGDEDFAFWFGDLNFRLDRIPGDDIRRLLMLHTQGEYDLSKRQLRRESSLDGEPIVIHEITESSGEATDSVPEEQNQERPDDKAGDTQGADDDSLVLPDPDEFPPDPHEDPASLQATLDSLLPHDQLKRLIKERRILHDGWREGSITFLPTYKYDVGTVALFDSSEKRRPPSWCDRILYRTRHDLEAYELKAEEEKEARKKDEEMKARGMEAAREDDEVLFSYDPDADGEDQPSSAGPEYDAYDEAADGGSAGEEVPSQAIVDRIHLDVYTSHQRITSSDHKPVSSIFTLDYDAVVPELKAKVHAEVARDLDRAENEGRPVITVVVDRSIPHDSKASCSESSLHVDFGEVRYLKKYTSSLTLANTGPVSAAFSFVDKPATEDSEGGNPMEMQWLTTSFVRPDGTGGDSEPVDPGQEVTLEPGETVNAMLDALVDDIHHARMLNGGQVTLEEVLVLRVKDGRDYFIPVRGCWAPTCVGRSVQELIRVPDGGIRRFASSLSEEEGRPGAISYDLPPQRPAPKELFRLIEAIETQTQRVLADAQMLEDCIVPEDPGWPFDAASCKSTDAEARTSHIIAILDALDQDNPVQSAFAPEISSVERLEAASQTLLLFLRSLTDGIVPAQLWHRIEQAAPSSMPSLASANPNGPALLDSSAATQQDQDRATILDILQSSPSHNVCFVFLAAMFERVVAELAPVSRAEAELVRNDPSSSFSPPFPFASGVGSVFAGVGRKSLGLVGRRATVSATPAPVAEAVALLEKRRARERRVAEVFAGVVCRGDTQVAVRERERRAAEEQKGAVLSLFVRGKWE